MNIFLATPIAGFESETQLLVYKKDIARFLVALKKEHKIWAEADRITSIEDYDAPYSSLRLDINQIAESEVFILHYPLKIVTSAIFELGIAVALHKQIIIIVPKSNMLPYLIQGIEKVLDNAIIIESTSLDNNCIAQVLKKLRKQ